MRPVDGRGEGIIIRVIGIDRRTDPVYFERLVTKAFPGLVKNNAINCPERDMPAAPVADKDSVVRRTSLTMNPCHAPAKQSLVGLGRMRQDTFVITQAHIVRVMLGASKALMSG
jgi:hypothetical protein